MVNESIVMKELHEIREKNYEKTKNMTIEEKLEYLKNRAKKGIEKLNMLKRVN